MVIVTCVEGYRWVIRAESVVAGVVQDALAANINHEKKTLDYMRSIAKPEHYFIDVGAHVGYYTIRMAKYVRKVVAIEPEPCNYNGLLQNIRLNKMKNVRAINKAASNHKSEMWLSCRGGGSSLFPVNCKEKVKVETDLLDNMIGTADIIKIDTEGHEFQVLQGATRLLKERKPTLIIENHEETYECLKGYFKQVKAFLLKYNYEGKLLDGHRWCFKRK